MRKQKFIANQYYHVSCHGVLGQDIFLETSDYIRIIFLITHLQSPIRMYNVSWYTNVFGKNGSFRVGAPKVASILEERQVELLAFSINQNGFQILVKNLGELLLSVYMQRVLTGYSKYFNAKYKKSGHVFSGPFNASTISGLDQVEKVSALIHRQLDKRLGSSGKYEQYPWSSYQDYIGLNRWGALLNADLIIKRFKDQKTYIDFVKSLKDLP